MKTGFYNLMVSPASFDYAHFAIAAKAAGCEKVIIVRGHGVNSWRYRRYGADGVERRINSILIPMTKALGMTPQVVEFGRAGRLTSHDCFPPGYEREVFVTHHMMTDLIPKMPLGVEFESTADMRNYSGCVAITIRDSEQQPGRNSNIDEWLIAASHIRSRGFRVVFIPDYDKPDSTFGEFDICRDAALDLNVRIGLMKAAAMNLCAANGPLVIAIYTSIPCLVFNLINRQYECTSGRQWIQSGIPVGGQPKWFGPHQRLTWKDDNHADIVAAFDEWRSRDRMTSEMVHAGT